MKIISEKKYYQKLCYHLEKVLESTSNPDITNDWIMQHKRLKHFRDNHTFKTTKKWTSKRT